MAERGAHLTGTTFIKPTIFEIVAQNSLASTLEPAFKKIFSFLLNFNPERYQWLEQWSDEAFAVFNGILQKFYLKNYSASFSETFYSLKRISLTNSGKKKLSNNQQRIFIILLVLQPYIKSKIHRCELDIVDGKLPKETWKRIMKIYGLKSYKLFHFIYEICGVYYYLAYMSDYSSYPSPLYRLFSVTLTYSNSIEVMSIPDLLYKLKKGTFSLNDGTQILQRVLMKFIELGAFFLQFYNWWNQEQYYTNLTALPVPRPPQIPDTAKRYEGLCAICLSPPNIPTALAVSGYIFCYQCILNKVQNDNRCPITKYPAREDDLIRIYIS
ncbi:peroxisome assembly protein 12 [Chelonus insularis]|uniref:peroxisome assembly protein 12 n=1 Tax=Chelonus insularis TaxID=460826 RepID=UPI00158AD313|nr:peroxisome assembly protein 12 [Chelonus insularis]